MTPTVLFYNLNNEKGRKLKLICLKLKIRIKQVAPEQYLQPIGALAGIKDFQISDELFDGNGFSEEMLVMKDFDNRLLDQFLAEFKRNNLKRVNLKAILTPENISWTSLKLYEELKKEHEAIAKQESINGIS